MPAHSHSVLLLLAALAVAGLIVLIVRYKVSAFIALALASIFLGLAAGLAPAAILKAFQDGFGAVLGSIAMVIALGAVLGKILGETRGAEAIAAGLVRRFGPKHLAPAFFLVGFVIGLPVFFAVGLVLVAPLLHASCKKTGLSLLHLGLPAVAGLSAAHGLVPPHPGPLAAIGLLNASIGKTILYSIPVGLAAGFAAGPLLFRFLKVPWRDPAETSGTPGAAHPNIAAAWAVLLLPIVLMAGASLSDVAVRPDHPVRPALVLLGHPVCALLMGVLFAYLALARPAGLSRDELLRLTESSLGPVAIILLVVGAGAGFSRVLIESGAGRAVAEAAARWSLPAVPLGFAIAGLIRVATGSATVAITTCAGLVRPVAEAQPGTNLELLVLSMGAGSLILSHVNDGGFWLVKEYLSLTVTEALRTWTVLETVLAVAAFGCILLLDAFF